MKRFVYWIGNRIPPTLSVFVAAIYLSNSVNVFTNIYGSGSLPPRHGVLLTSCVGSLLAAALWTAVAGKSEVIERAAISSSVEIKKREEVRKDLWGDVWARYLLYLTGAVCFSIFSLAILI
jgi:hypothetical protein